MADRREFFRTVAGAGAAALAAGGSTAFPHRGGGRGAAAPVASGPRREVGTAGKGVRGNDVHCHCVIDVADVVKGTPLERQARGGGNNVLGPGRIALMDQQGLDIQALSINGYWWYAADRDLARRIVQTQNEGL